ncbi:MDR family MFS transporter [Paenibacillus sp. Marseille-Q4541]|uniref:MDR family MFS transporter n=1 Tax=Paenibacillus sp. Marseille-Q4541 TaxID=2831522 RepID=UPI001BAD7083|nr:MDR family MFS transporter [Paenibacillus sp. Marseille-Q4541]
MNTTGVNESADNNGQKSISFPKTGQLLAVLLSGAFVAILNETLLNVALFQIMGDLNIEPHLAQWLSTSYMLVIGVLIPVSAFLVQRFTTRQLYLSAMTLFLIGTVLAAISSSFGILLLGRVIQAVGTAILIPLMMNIILAVIPIERRGAAMGLIGLVLMFAPAIGPTLSGFILQHLSWRWLFILVAPIVAVTLIFGIIKLRNVTSTSRPKLDVFSIVLSTLGFGGLVFGFGSMGEGGGGAIQNYVTFIIAISAISLALFVWRQIKLSSPVMDMKVFIYPMFSVAVVLSIIVMMTMFAMMLVLPLYLQEVLLYSALMTGMVMLPGGLLNGLMSPVMGKVFDKFGPRILLLPGMIMLIITIFGFMQLSLESPWLVMILQTFLMISIAMIMMPAQTNGLNALPAELYPHGTAVLTTLQQTLGALGAAIFISIMQNGEKKALAGITNPQLADTNAAMTAGVMDAFTVGLILACLGFVVALFVKRVAGHTASGADSTEQNIELARKPATVKGK